MIVSALYRPRDPAKGGVKKSDSSYNVSVGRRLLIPLRPLFINVPAVKGLDLHPVPRSSTLVATVRLFADDALQAELICCLE